jgi:biotin carboxylase
MTYKKMKRLLMLGGGHSEIPLILAAKELGYFVISTGNNPKGLGHAYADRFVCADFSNPLQMLKLAKDERVEAICSGCNDFALLSAAFVGESLGFKGHDSFEVSKKIHHKDKFRALCQELGVFTPKAFRACSIQDLEECIEKLDFPVMVKPIDLTGGKGISKVHSLAMAKEAFLLAIQKSKSPCVVVEEFVTGTNHGFSALIQDQKVVFYFADNEQYFLNPYLVSGANTPSTLQESSLKQLKNDVEKIAQTLNLCDGIFHVQLIESPKHGPVIIEACRRAPGDFYVELVRYATGVPYSKYLVMAETGKGFPKISKNKRADFVLRHCVMANEEGVFESIEFDPRVDKNIFDKHIWAKKGDWVEDKLYYKAGIVFLKFDELQEMQDKTLLMNEYIKCKINPFD